MKSPEEMVHIAEHLLDRDYEDMAVLFDGVSDEAVLALVAMRAVLDRREIKQMAAALMRVV